MVILVTGKPQITKVPYLKLDGLKAGTYRFQLRVFDSVGNVSNADMVTIKIGTRIEPIPNVNLRDNVFNRNPRLPRFTLR